MYPNHLLWLTTPTPLSLYFLPVVTRSTKVSFLITWPKNNASLCLILLQRAVCVSALLHLSQEPHFCSTDGYIDGPGLAALFQDWDNVLLLSSTLCLVVNERRLFVRILLSSEKAFFTWAILELNSFVDFLSDLTTAPKYLKLLTCFREWNKYQSNQTHCDSKRFVFLFMPENQKKRLLNDFKASYFVALLNWTAVETDQRNCQIWKNFLKNWIWTLGFGDYCLFRFLPLKGKPPLTPPPPYSLRALSVGFVLLCLEMITRK